MVAERYGNSDSRSDRRTAEWFARTEGRGGGVKDGRMLLEATVESMEQEAAWPPREPETVPRSRPAPLILASRSARRRALLTEAGIAHEPAEPAFEDGVLSPGSISPSNWVMSLAYLKAWAKARETPPDRVVLGADTTCVVDGRLVGTPRDADEAREIIESFIGREHEVLTGVALVEGGCLRRRLFIERASVRFGAVTPDQVTEYIASGRWQGKAGAYNLSERIEAGWLVTFTGDPHAIMGLPIARLKRELAIFMESTELAA